MLHKTDLKKKLVLIFQTIIEVHTSHVFSVIFGESLVICIDTWYNLSIYKYSYTHTIQENSIVAPKMQNNFVLKKMAQTPVAKKSSKEQIPKIKQRI